MAGVWKKVFTSADTITLANGGTGSTSTTKGVTTNTGSELSSVAMDTAHLLIGQGTNATPTSSAVTGDVTITSGGVTSIGNGKVVTAKIDDNAVTFAKMQDLNAGDIIRGLDSGEPGALSVGTNGYVLTVDTTEDGKLKWAAAPSAANVTVQDGQNDTAAQPILFGSGVGNDKTVRGDASDLTYEADVAFAHVTGNTLGSGTAAGAVLATRGFVGDLAGTASAANLTKVTKSNISSANHSLFLTPAATNDGEYVAPIADSNLTWNGTKLTVNGALEVKGDVTQTHTSVVNSEFQDVIIRVGGGITSSSAAQSTHTAGIGLAIDNGSAADANLARFVYKGAEDSASVLGWRISQEANNTATAAASTYGVGVMHVTSAAFDTTNTDDIGVGAMVFSSDANGGLFIQTAVSE